MRKFTWKKGSCYCFNFNFSLGGEFFVSPLTITIGLCHTSYSLLEVKVPAKTVFFSLHPASGEKLICLCLVHLLRLEVTFDNISIDDVFSFTENTGKRTIKCEVAFRVLNALYFFYILSKNFKQCKQ